MEHETHGPDLFVDWLDADLRPAKTVLKFTFCQGWRA